MPFSGPHTLAALVAAMAATIPVYGQDRTPEQRLVQAFIRYCVGTSADSDLLRAEIEKGAPLKPYGETRFGNRSFMDAAEILDSTARNDPATTSTRTPSLRSTPTRASSGGTSSSPRTIDMTGTRPRCRCSWTRRGRARPPNCSCSRTGTGSSTCSIGRPGSFCWGSRSSK